MNIMNFMQKHKILVIVIGALIALNLFQFYQPNVNTNMMGNQQQNGYGQQEQVDVAELAKEVIPSGTPSYGNEARLSYDNVEQSIETLISYTAIELSNSEEKRYNKIASTPGTACEYCCGIGGTGFGYSDGKIACGCSHNIAFAGLTKWMIKNIDATNEQIVNEIHNWKAVFFPQDTMEVYMASQGMNGMAALPEMQGGC